jgi:hypothetical protein
VAGSNERREPAERPERTEREGPHLCPKCQYPLVKQGRLYFHAGPHGRDCHVHSWLDWVIEGWEPERERRRHPPRTERPPGA